MEDSGLPDDRIEFSNLLDKFLPGFGHVILQWSRYEMALAKLMCLIAGCESNWLIFNSNMNYVQKRDTFKALLEWPENELSDNLKAFLKALVGKCEELNNLRNDVAHGLWQEGRRSGSITPMGLKAKGTIRFRGVDNNQHDYAPEDLEKAAGDLYLYASALLEICDNVQAHNAAESTISTSLETLDSSSDDESQ